MTTPATGAARADTQTGGAGGSEHDRRTAQGETETTLSVASAVASAGLTHRPRAADGRFVRVDGAGGSAGSGSGAAGDGQALALPEDRFLDREISWLQFNERVLQLAADPDLPLLERARFLAIFASNLDEFFMVRVAGLKRRVATGLAVRSASGLEPRELLESIHTVADELMRKQARVFTDLVGPALADEGIHLVSFEDLDEDERERLSNWFAEQVFPVLTPLAVDPSHPFPYISGLSLNLAVVLVNAKTGSEHFARVKVPPLLPRFVHIPVRDGEDDELYSARL